MDHACHTLLCTVVHHVAVGIDKTYRHTTSQPLAELGTLQVPTPEPCRLPGWQIAGQ